jgi:hypothetical protein
MITHPIITDLARLAASEAHSALPDAPIIEEQTRPSRVGVIPATRIRVTRVLRWTADVVEPASPCPATQPGC